MRIIVEALGYRIREVTNGYFMVERPGFPEDLSVFDPFIDQMVVGAKQRGHFEIIKPGVEYLLAHDEIDLESYGSDENWAWSDEEVRALLVHMRGYLWPDAGPLPDGGPPGVELVSAPGPTWGLTMPALLPEN